VKKKFYNFQFEKADNEQRTIMGMATTFGNKDLDDDIIVDTAFDEQFGAETSINAKALWQHRFDTPIGMNIVQKVQGGLQVIMKLAEGVQKADEALALAKQGIIDSFSIGFGIPSGGYRYDEQREAYIISKAELREVSLVTFPANPLAKISDVKNANDQHELKLELISHLREAGYAKSLVETVINAGVKALGDPKGEDEAQKNENVNGLLLDHLNQIKGSNHVKDD